MIASATSTEPARGEAHRLSCDASGAETLMALEFTLAAFNVFLRWRTPFFIDGQLARAERIARWLDDPSLDAVALSEAFDPVSRALLLERLHVAFPHRTRLLGARTRPWRSGNGGVIIVSRWPIEEEDECVFEPPSPGEEGLVNKGVVYARIRKKTQCVHVFATHAYAPFRPAHVRARQFEQVCAFIQTRGIAVTEPVLVAGDLNVHRHCEPDYRQLLKTLDACHPSTHGHEATYDPRCNRLAVGRTPLFLDYVLYLRGHLTPTQASNEVVRPSCDEWQRFPWSKPLRELSDHYPVVGRFTF